MAPFEVMISECQERMLAIVRPDALGEVARGLRALGPAVRGDRAGHRRRRRHVVEGGVDADGRRGRRSQLARIPAPP